MRLLPRDERFFDLFNAVAELNVRAAEQLQELIQADAHRRVPLVEAIKRLEHEADQITHEVVNRLDRSFVTPLDREDIHLLISRLDDVMDVIDGTARRCHIFHAGQPPQGAVLLTGVIRQACEQILTAVQGLTKDREDAVIPALIRVKKLEEDGDSLYHEWVGRLFEGTPDPLTVMKWKEIYDTLEKTLDLAEDVANVLESISIKHS